MAWPTPKENGPNALSSQSERVGIATPTQPLYKLARATGSEVIPTRTTKTAAIDLRIVAFPAILASAVPREAQTGPDIEILYNQRLSNVPGRDCKDFRQAGTNQAGSALPLSCFKRSFQYLTTRPASS